MLLNSILSGGAFIWVYLDGSGLSLNDQFNILSLVISSVPTILFMHMPSCSCCGGCGCCNIHNDVHLYDADTGLVIRQDDQDTNNEDDIEMAQQ